MRNAHSRLYFSEENLVGYTIILDCPLILNIQTMLTIMTNLKAAECYQLNAVWDRYFLFCTTEASCSVKLIWQSRF